MSKEKIFIYSTSLVTLTAIILEILVAYYFHQRMKGTILWMGLIFAMAILGTFVCLAKYRQWVTEEIAQELYRRNIESEARYKTLFDGAGDAIYTFDIYGNCLSINKAAARLLGGNPEEFIGKNMSSIFLSGVADQYASNYKRLFETGEDIISENQFKFGDNVQWFSTRWTPVKDEKGEILYGIGISRDITEKKRMEQALIQAERLAATGKLAAQIAHEINNPLQGILYTFTFILEDPGLDPQNREMVQLAIRETHRIAELVRNMINFHQPTDKGVEPININQLLQETLLFLKRPLQDKRIVTVIQLDNHLPTLWINKSQMRQVFLNLINNAQDAMVEGGRLEISTRSDQESICIDFTDTGCGIPKEILNDIFDIFFSTKGIKGVGVGLSVCYGIIQQHGGNIEVKSQVGVGSTFTIRLPIQPGSSNRQSIIDRAG